MFMVPFECVRASLRGHDQDSTGAKKIVVIRKKNDDEMNVARAININFYVFFSTFHEDISAH